MNKTSERGFVVLLLTVIVSLVIGFFLFATGQRDDLIRRGLVETEAGERHRSALQSLASSLRVLIEEEAVTVGEGPTFLPGKQPLPKGWTLKGKALVASSCDQSAFKPSTADPAFRDLAGVLPVCTGETSTYRLDAQAIAPPDVLVIEATAEAGKKAKAPWSGVARIRVASGCYIAPRTPVKFSVAFPAFAPGCPFSVFATGNLPPANGIITARNELTRSLDAWIPRGAELCELKLNAPPSSLYYDDQLILHLSGAALMNTSAILAAYLGTSNGVMEYSWSKLVGRPYVTNEAVAYCFGQELLQPGSLCLVPKTETSGPIALAFPSKALIPVSRWIKDKNLRFELTLVAAGDDNPEKDCRTSPINLTGEASYIPK